MTRLARDIIKSEVDEDYFNKRVIKTDRCWEWVGSITPDTGYGYYTVKQKRFYAHRISYCLYNGSISREMVIDHICKNTICVNPLHLREVTTRFNVIDNSNSPFAIHSRKTHCLRGHEYFGDNLRFGKNAKGYVFRVCKKCLNAYRVRYYHKKKEKKNVEE